MVGGRTKSPLTDDHKINWAKTVSKAHNCTRCCQKTQPHPLCFSFIKVDFPFPFLTVASFSHPTAAGNSFSPFLSSHLRFVSTVINRKLQPFRFTKLSLCISNLIHQGSLLTSSQLKLNEFSVLIFAEMAAFLARKSLLALRTRQMVRLVSILFFCSLLFDCKLRCS